MILGLFEFLKKIPTGGGGVTLSIFWPIWGKTPIPAMALKLFCGGGKLVGMKYLGELG